MTTQIVKTGMTVSPDEGIQAAVRLSTNGCFQVWTSLRQDHGGQADNEWVDVEAEGVTPTSGKEYTLRFTFDYAAGTYGVEVDDFALRLQLETPTSSFPLAFSTNCVRKVAFAGLTRFTSLRGECRFEASGFAADETLILSNNVQLVLDAARAQWLNRCTGGKAAVGDAAAGLSADDFDKAYLLNLDITGVEDVEGPYSFQLTGVDVDHLAEKVTIGLTLARTGEISKTINGVLKFYGAATVEAFACPDLAPLVDVTLSDDDFSEGGTATAEIPLKGDTPPTFFKATIE